MTFCNLDYKPQIPVKPSKLTLKMVFFGLETFRGDFLEIGECNFYQKLIFVSGPQALWALWISEKTVDWIGLEPLQSWKSGRGQCPQSIRGTPILGVRLRWPWALATFCSINTALLLLSTYFFWGCTQNFKNSPLPYLGAEGFRIVQAPIYSRREGSVKTAQG